MARATGRNMSDKIDRGAADHTGAGKDIRGRRALQLRIHSFRHRRHSVSPRFSEGLSFIAGPACGCDRQQGPAAGAHAGLSDILQRIRRRCMPGGRFSDAHCRGDDIYPDVGDRHYPPGAFWLLLDRKGLRIRAALDRLVPRDLLSRRGTMVGRSLHRQGILDCLAQCLTSEADRRRQHGWYSLQPHGPASGC